MKKKFLTLLAFVCGLNGMKADEGMDAQPHFTQKHEGHERFGTANERKGIV